MSDKVTPEIIVDNTRIHLLETCVRLYQEALVEARGCCGCGAGSDKEVIADFLLGKPTNPSVLEFRAIESAFDRVYPRASRRASDAPTGPDAPGTGGSVGFVGKGPENEKRNARSSK